MAGPSAAQAEVVLVWKAAIDILESFRVHADDTQAVEDGKLQVLEEYLTGDYMPEGVAAASANFRRGLSDLIDTTTIRAFLDPIIQEWGLVIDNDAGGDTFGGAYGDIDGILASLYELFINNSDTIETRGITYAAPSAMSGTGNGVLRRFTVDADNEPIEACTIEKKHFRCRQDQNSGVDKWAEVFEHLGSAESKDALRQADHGSGRETNVAVTSRHAGGGDGGSLLQNSSFQNYGATSTPKFTGWTQSFTNATAADIASSTTVYRSFPGETTAGAISCGISIDANLDKVTLSQTVTNMALSEFRTDRPYFLRVMVADGTSAATNGTIYLRMGTQAVSMNASDLTTAWQELVLPLDTNSWYENFKKDSLTIEIEWHCPTGTPSGQALFDDMILCEGDLIDGTYWVMGHNNATPTAALVDDLITQEDTGTYGNGKLQYYLYRGYGRYLPSAGTPTITDP